MKKDEQAKIGAYFLLYRFLRENRILDKYLKNLVEHGTMKYQKGNYSNILKELVNNFTFKSIVRRKDVYYDLFNYALTSFYFDESNEGYKFWCEYIDKWQMYYRNNKNKFFLE